MPDREFKVLITGDASGISQSAAEGGKSLEGMGEKGKEAHKGIGEAAEKLGLKHKDLHAGIRALREEFPLLSHIAHLALNPLGLAVAGIAGAFALWEKRIDMAKEALAGLELPDVKGDSIGHVNALADAWGKYAEAVAKAKESVSGIAAESDRSQASIARELEQNKKLIQSVHDYAAAKLEAQRDSMSPAEYEKKKLDLGAAAGSATAGEEHQAAIDAFAVKVSEVLDLRESAREKSAKASGIKIASKEDDAQTLERFTKRREAAEKDIEEREQRANKLRSAKAGEGHGLEKIMNSLWASWYVMGTGASSIDEAIEIEEQGIANARPDIERQNQFRARLPGRDKARAQREELFGGAAADMAKSIGIEAGLPDEEAGINAQTVATKKEQTLAAAAAAYKALADVHKQVVQASEEIKKSIESTGGFSTATFKKLEEFVAAQKVLEERVKSLESTRASPMH